MPSRGSRGPPPQGKTRFTPSRLLQGGFPDIPVMPPAVWSMSAKSMKDALEKTSTKRESPHGFASRCAADPRGFHARGARCPPTSEPRSLTRRPLRVYTHGRWQPSGVRAPVPGRLRRVGDGEELEGEEAEVVRCPLVCLCAVAPWKPPARQTRVERTGLAYRPSFGRSRARYLLRRHLCQSLRRGARRRGAAGPQRVGESARDAGV